MARNGSPSNDAVKVENGLHAFERVCCGVLVQDDFSTDELDTAEWRVFQEDPGIAVSVRPGQLRLCGTTTNEHGLHAVGVVSRAFAEADVVLVASIRPVSGIVEEAEGAEGYHVQLGGAGLKHYYQVTFGRSEKGPTGWFIRYVDNKGHVQIDTSKAARLMNEEFIYNEVVIEREAANGYTRGWLVSGNSSEQKVIELAAPRSVAMAACEAQLSMTTTRVGAKREMQVSRVRLYRRPEGAPLVCCVTDSSGGAPANVVIQVVAGDGQTLLGQNKTDSDGIARITLKPPSWALFPQPATIKVIRRAAEVGRAVVSPAASGGVFPGDVWSATLGPES